ncbi:CPBP family intramembrane glutamic endopeptidase [Nocardioides iriomotensis]|uniref:CPBP family intramembrane metalloprotease n=1 Tax=Nocardioides iriomotensis TaxID=715784 RepID=A0A4Q5J1M6_9ACTN|nr:CPBP family intramembrane glutamic endopeptidase [Nocardioides iriomotensis]RYU12294.1 CPBP family intramembrane metalloprotease [Nocardioides iriomotensis]
MTDDQQQPGSRPAEGWAPPRPPAPRFPPPAYGAVPAAYPAPSSHAAAAWGAPTAVRQAYPAFPHPEPTPYHQMLRTWTYRWWRPLVGLAVLAGGFLLTQVLAAIAIIVLAVSGPGDMFDNLTSLANLEDIGPAFLLLLNLSLGAMILVSWLAIRVAHRMRPRWLTSVAPKMRWGFFWACVGISVIALAAQLAVSMVVPAGGDASLGTELNDFTAQTVGLALIVLFTTPFQAAGEEYLFRGYLMQAAGSLLKFNTSRAAEIVSKWGAILLTSLLFAAAHGAQNFPLFFDRFSFGFIAGWLIIRTGGLEAGIAMHILNNFFALGAALLFGDIGSSLNVSEASWWNIPITLTQAGVYTVLVVLLANRLGVQTHTRPPAEPPATPDASASTPVPA